MQASILVLGGNGYIGSHTNLELLEKDYFTVVGDKVRNSKFESYKNWIYRKLDLQDLESIRKVFKEFKFNGVIHFAASIEVSESQQNPEKYYYNNVVGSLNLLKVMREFQVKNLIFSSTAAVYGIPNEIPISESSSKSPINTYGKTKLVVEEMIADYSKAYGMSAICLRYFNACGADKQNRSGESHQPETHLIPNILKAIKNPNEVFKINGDDYPTSDGTCVRDYIHVTDLATAHVLALEKILKQDQIYKTINLGTKRGFSIKEIIQVAEKVTKKKVSIAIGKRRPGDPAVLVADNQEALKFLNWQPVHSDLENIITTAWNWYLTT